MNKKNFICGVAVGALSVSIIFGAFNIYMLKASGFTKEDKIAYISQLLNEYYVDDIDNEKLFESAYAGLVAGVGDPYTTYMSKDEFEDFMSSSNGEFGGIGVGVLFNDKNKTVYVSYVTEGSPAESAGIRPGDKIVEINGESVSDMDSDTVANKIRGPQGTSVDILVYRQSYNENHSFTIKRDIIDIQSVKGEIINGDIGYIYISGFKNNTYDQFMNAYNNLSEQGIRGLIIDVRDNPGGLLTSVEKIADEIIPEGNVVYTIDKEGNRKDFNADPNYIDIPMVMLVNGNSASASEILAGAFQDRGRGKLVGTQTFGKGLVQNLYKIPDGSAVKITIEKYYTPKGVCIQGIGITPDYIVENESDLASVQLIPHSEDAQLIEAVRVLESEM